MIAVVVGPELITGTSASKDFRVTWVPGALSSRQGFFGTIHDRLCGLLPLALVRRGGCWGYFILAEKVATLTLLPRFFRGPAGVLQCEHRACLTTAAVLPRSTVIMEPALILPLQAAHIWFFVAIILLGIDIFYSAFLDLSSPPVVRSGRPLDNC